MIVSDKNRPFSCSDPALWFVQIETNLAVRNTTSHSKTFNFMTLVLLGTTVMEMWVLILKTLTIA